MASAGALDTPLPSSRSLVQRRQAVAGGLIGLAVLAVLVASFGSIRPSGDGGVQGITRAGPSESAPEPSQAMASPSTPASSAPATTPAASATPAASNVPSPSATNAAPSGQGGEPILTLGQIAVRAWKGPYGETRLQVILPVRNDDARWVRLGRSVSTYRIVTPEDREVASGIFTAALPAMIAPGETGYLVDTVSVAFVDPTGAESVEADVRATPTDPPVGKLSVAALQAATGADGGLRVTGQVQNEGPIATRWVMAGAVALGQDGSALGAVYDPSDIGRMEPGETLPFDTEYPGAPPLPAGLAVELVGVAFEADP